MTGRERYAFSDHTLDVAERRLAKNGASIALAPKAFDVLVHLVRRAGHLVTKRELLDEVWPDAFVEEGILSVHISALRKALDDAHRAPEFIETVARAGYRFLSPVIPEPVAGYAGAGVALPAGTEVYELVGRGRAHLLSHSLPEVPHAVAAFEAAIDRAPTFAAAHAGLALACCRQAEFRLVPAADAFSRARASALRALALDSGSADAQLALGVVLFLGEWDWVGAERSLQRTLEINPNHTEACVWYGRLLESRGRLQDGLDLKRRALERDPFSPFVHLAIAASSWHQRRYEDAITWARKTLELEPRHLLAREFLAGAFWAMGDFDRHMAENLEHARCCGVPAEALAPVREVFAAGGRPAVVRWTLETQGDRLPPFQLALLHGELGDLDTAIDWLNRAIDGRDPCLVDLAVAPQWDRLRADPRFEGCLARMGLSQGHAPDSAIATRT